ncbi:MAG TPA: Gfo/Idh/MocA family oxidoreductase [Rhodocyclaceae bacterium]
MGTDAPLRLGVLGCASIARRMMLPAIKALPEAQLVAVASRDPARARAFAGEFGCAAEASYEALLDRPDIDAIYLPLPPAMHEEWSVRALKAGKHVLCEKPAATGLAGAQRMAAAAQAHGRLLAENFMFLFHPQLRAIDDLVAKGELGEIRLLRATFGFPPLPEGDIRYRRELGGGALLDAGCYTLRAARHFLGDTLDVAGATRNWGANGVDIAGTALLFNPAGVSAQLAFSFDLFYQCELQLILTRGRITAPRIFTAPPTLSPHVVIETAQGRQELGIPPHNHFASSLAHFVQQVRAGATGAPGVASQAELMEGVESSCHRST